MQTGREVVESRKDKYNGISYEERAVFIQEVKALIRKSAHSLDHPHLETLDMIAHKIGRIVLGDPDDIDSWLDIAGYAELMVQYLTEMKEEMKR